MQKFSQEQLAREWARHLERFSPEIKQYIQDLAERHQSLLADHFYSHMLEDPQASTFLSHEQVKTRLHASMQRWITGVFSLHEEQSLEAVVAHQVKIGEVHARVSIPVHLVLQGARHLKKRMEDLVHQDDISDLQIRIATSLIAVNIDLAMEIMSYAYAASTERNSRAEEAYRLFAVAQDIGNEKERQRGALLDWENQLMYGLAMGLALDQLPRIQSSEFGLWFRHKGAHAFEGAAETGLILETMSKIDSVLLPTFKFGQAQDQVQHLRELRECSKSIRYHLDRLFEQNNELESGRDVLTRLLNRKFLPVVMARQLNQARAENKPFAVLLIDIDHFKRINDNHGHEAGDHVLQQLSSFLVNTSRAGDYLFRLGGEEFLMLLVDVDEKSALRTAEKLCTAVSREDLKLPHSQSVRVTLSIGLAMFNGHPDYQYLLRRADEALYQAKQGGRNRVVIAGN